MPLVTGLTETLGLEGRSPRRQQSRTPQRPSLHGPWATESKNELRAEKPPPGLPRLLGLPTGASALEGKWVFSQRDAAQAGKMGVSRDP